MDDKRLRPAQLQVPSDLDLLPDVVQWFEQFQEAMLPYPLWLQGNMALIEGFTNAVRHAHQELSPETPVSLNAFVADHHFYLEIWDRGQPYDFSGALAELKKITASPDFDPLEREKQWGGIIFLRLIEQHHWSIEYLRQGDSSNCLRAAIALP